MKNSMLFIKVMTVLSLFILINSCKKEAHNATLTYYFKTTPSTKFDSLKFSFGYTCAYEENSILEYPVDFGDKRLTMDRVGIINHSSESYFAHLLHHHCGDEPVVLFDCQNDNLL